MASVNKVILMGNLGRDPETRFTANGGAVCNLRIATTRTWKDKNSGLAEIAGEYLRKGRPVYVEGRLQTRKWQDKEGQDRYTTEIVATEMQLLGSRDSGGGGGGEEGAAPARAAAASAGAGAAAGSGAARKPGKALDDIDDDIPF